MAIIAGTYTDEDVCKTYLAVEFYDAATLTANITAQAVNARRRVNNYLGRSTNFTPTQLADEKYAGIVDGASQLTACLVQMNPQERADLLAEGTKEVCKEAYTTLKTFALNNGITPIDMKKASISPKTELVYIYSDVENVI